MQKCSGITFLHVGRVHYYIRDNTPNGDIYNRTLLLGCILPKYIK